MTLFVSPALPLIVIGEEPDPAWIEALPIRLLPGQVAFLASAAPSRS